MTSRPQVLVQADRESAAYAKGWEDAWRAITAMTHSHGSLGPQAEDGWWKIVATRKLDTRTLRHIQGHIDLDIRILGETTP